MILVIVLLALWAGLTMLGFAVKSLLWLAIVGCVLFVLTGLFGLMVHH